MVEGASIKSEQHAKHPKVCEYVFLADSRTVRMETYLANIAICRRSLMRNPATFSVIFLHHENFLELSSHYRYKPSDDCRHLCDCIDAVFFVGTYLYSIFEMDSIHKR